MLFVGGTSRIAEEELEIMVILSLQHQHTPTGCLWPRAV